MSKGDRYLSAYILFITCAICFLLYVICFTSFYTYLLHSYNNHGNKVTSSLSSDEDQQHLHESYFMTNGIPVVSLPDGQVMGKVIQGYDKKRVYTFLGIPYASPPVGGLRFRRTVPVAPWNGVKKTTEYPPNCLQVFPDFISDVMRPVNLSKSSEDCLYLNIWTPTLNPSSKKAVLFWIHGGAFQFGSGSNIETDGRILSSFGDVIVVTHNYRLNAFGFLNLGTDEVAGNMGMYDQVMAIKWVKNNIMFFGGDPDQITLWGESSGAVSVSAHIVSPVTQDLFRRAILESGALFMQEVVFNQYEDLANKLLDKIGCTTMNKSDTSSNTREKKMIETEEDDDEGNEEENDEDDEVVETDTESSTPVSKSFAGSDKEDKRRMDCLMSTPGTDILKAVKIMNEVNPMSFVISPGEFFLDSSSPKNIRNELKNFLPSQGKDLLMGFNSDEGSLILNSMLADDFDRYSSPSISTVDKARELLIDLFSSRFHVPKQIVRTALPTYLPDEIDDNNSSRTKSTLLAKGIYDFIGHNVFVCPVITFADEILKTQSMEGRSSNNKNFNIFMYEFSGKTSYTKKLDPWMGSGGLHYEEVPLVFGLPFMKTSSSHSSSFKSKDSRLSLKFMQSWINFAKTG